MSRRQISIKHAHERRLATLALTVALIAAVLPLTRAQQSDARPRRATNTNQQPPSRTTPPPSARQPQTAAPATGVKPTPTPAAAKPQPSTSPAPPTLQTKPTPGPQSSDASNQAPQEIDPEELITIDTNLTRLNVRVIDRANRPVNDVKQGEFRVFEDGVLQQIDYFSREEVPISYGLVIDNSGSLRFQINQVIEAGKTIINSNKTGDETFLVRFVSNDKIETVQDFTSDQEQLMDALEQLYTEGGQTAVIDAVMLSAERVAEYKKGSDLNDRRRRALILVTDGEDRSSFYKQEELFAELRENDVQIFVIGFVNELDAQGGLIRKSPKEKAVNLLNKLAEQTGGRAFFPTSLSELPQIAQEITKDLRTQYVIGYYPTNKARDGSFRTVRVQVADASKRDKRLAITRSGYTARRDPGATSNKPTTPTNNRPRQEN